MAQPAPGAAPVLPAPPVPPVQPTPLSLTLPMMVNQAPSAGAAALPQEELPEAQVEQQQVVGAQPVGVPKAAQHQEVLGGLVQQPEAQLVQVAQLGQQPGRARPVAQQPMLLIKPSKPPNKPPRVLNRPPIRPSKL